MKCVSYILMVIFILIGVAFITLLERKVLGYIQLRKGPNSVGFLGILQPFSDAIKLFSKEVSTPSLGVFFVYYLSPIFGLFLACLLWVFFPLSSELMELNFGILVVLCIMSVGVYTILGAGWSSNSKYALLGGLRSVAQTISYEVSFIMILLCPVMMVGSFNFLDLSSGQSYMWFMGVFFPLMLMLFISCLAETNRTPFDFAEGESELVSGFNVEYSSGGFALIFLAEYMNIFFMSFIVSVFYLGGMDKFLMVKVLFFSFSYLWVRGTLPRFRYDKLMYMVWKVFLPVVLGYLILVFSGVAGMVSFL
uniref:NADH-ubiquinone oxidoreductase chain 1 n=1 Tax=Lepidocampa weberi TaxID=165470 RepID=U3KTN8_9HEXA|nr:NADH dehydrogenase subunit 1 [Lepidocampa weberi]AEV44885.1 NADH dehydrogenase subunit 1 [Lepidocampa weberi]